jgi:hypothetical protein
VRGSKTATGPVADSTLFNNSDGSGIDNDGGATTVTATTIFGGSKSKTASGIENSAGSVRVATTIIAKTGKKGDCSGSVVGGGYNLADDNTCGFSVGNHSLSDEKPELGQLANNGGPTETAGLEPSCPANNAVNDPSLCSTPDQRGDTRPTPCDIGPVQLTLSPEAITSPNSATATVHSSFSFTVTTSGTPTPSITESGKLPKGLKLKDNHNGTATISGTPKKAGVTHVTMKATFVNNGGSYIATQAFTMAVDAG